MILSLLEQRDARGPMDDFLYMPTWLTGGGRKTASPDEALGLSAWYNGIGILAGTIGSLPLKLYRRTADGRELVRNDPRFRLVHRQPNRWQTAFEFREMAQGHLLVAGNQYSIIETDRTGRAVALHPVHPRRVRVLTRDGELSYRVTTGSGPEDIPARRMLHLRGLGGDGIVGWSVAALAARSLGYALQLETHGAEFMGNKGRPGGILKTDQVLTKATKEQFAETWDKQFQAGGLGKTAVIDAGLTWQQVGFNAEESQFLESRKFQAEEVGRWLNIPPHMLKLLDRSTNNNIEHQGIEFVTHTIRPWAERWEQRYDLTLLDDSERDDLFFKFSLEGLLRGDSKTKAEYFGKLFSMGVLSPNDIRELEDLNRVEGGDERFIQVNLMPLSSAADPFVSTERSGLLPENRSEIRPDAEFRARVQRSLVARRRLSDSYRALMESAAGRLVQREVQDLRRILAAADDDVPEFLRRLGLFAEGLPEMVRSIMLPLLSSYMELVAAESAQEVELQDLPTERVEGFQRAYVDALARGHTSETVGRIQGAAEADNGLLNVAVMLDRWEENRATEIALREVVTAGAAVSRMVYTIGGFDTVWRTFGESCPYCKSLNGKRVGPGTNFLNAGDTLEGDENHEPLTVRRRVGHPPAHLGCDCGVSAGG